MKTFLIALLFMCSSAFADGLAIKDGKVIRVDEVINPVISFVKPDKISPGMLIVKAKLDNYAKEYVTNISYNWRVIEGSQDAAFIISKDDSVIAFGADENTKLIKINVDIDLSYKIDSEDFVHSIHGEISLNNSAPKPPIPDLPEYAAFLDKQLQKSMSLYPNMDRQVIIDSALAQANNYREVVKLIDDGSTLTAKQLLDILYKKNNTYIENTRNSSLINMWTDVGNNISNYLFEIYSKQGSSIKKEQLGEIFSQFADALEMVK